MLKVTREGFTDLSEEEQEEYQFQDEPSFLRVAHNGTTIFLKSDAMEPEDASFGRDLGWITSAIKKAYELGVQDGAGANGSDK